MRERQRQRDGGRRKPLLDSVHCPLSSAPTLPCPSVLCPAMAAEEQPALLWSATDMDPREDGDYTYVPTQLYPAQPEHGPHAPQNLPPLAFGRLRQMSATEHVNATVGNIYIGNCVEPMDWAGEHVGYIIDASDGNYAWHPNCIRQWLWVSKGRRHKGSAWLQRMEHAVKMVFIAVLFGSSVLIHCRQGKHRSGATG